MGAMALARPGDTTRISNPPDDPSEGPSYRPFITADGRLVAFQSGAALVSGDTNQSDDIYVFDRQNQVLERVSVSSTLTQGNGHSQFPSMSADGRYVVFESVANNLAPGDTNATWDVFVHDRLNGITDLVSVNSAGQVSNLVTGDRQTAAWISSDGKFVGFFSKGTNLADDNGDGIYNDDTNGRYDAFVRDLQSGITKRVSFASNAMGGGQGNHDSVGVRVSTGGRFVVFHSLATNLVPGDSNATYDVFVRDTHPSFADTFLVSKSSSGTIGNNISAQPFITANGRYVFFGSWASNLVSGDTNGNMDAFRHDRFTGVTERISKATSGQQGFPCMSSIPSAQRGSYGWTSSSDGRFVAIGSCAPNIAPRDFVDRDDRYHDIFVFDLLGGGIYRSSVDSGGREGDGHSWLPVVSDDGKFVTFESEATNLSGSLFAENADGNGLSDVYVHEVCLEEGFLSSRVHSDLEPLLPVEIAPSLHYVDCHYVADFPDGV